MTYPVAPDLVCSAVSPIVTGTPRVGETLVCSTGAWTGSPTAYEFKWLAYTPRALRWREIGHYAQAYTIAPVAAGKRLACLVIAYNASGQAVSQSAFTAVVRQ